MNDWRKFKQKAIELYGNKASELKGSLSWKELVENYKDETEISNDITNDEIVIQIDDKIENVEQTDNEVIIHIDIKDEDNDQINDEKTKVSCFICKQNINKLSRIPCYVIDPVKMNYLPYLKLSISLCDILCAKIFHDHFHKIGIDEEKYYKLRDSKYLNQNRLDVLYLCSCLFIQLPDTHNEESDFLKIKEELIECMRRKKEE